MPDIKLPDGKVIKFKNQVNGFQIAEKISKSLAKEACVISVDGEIKDTPSLKMDDSNNRSNGINQNYDKMMEERNLIK